MPKEVTHLSDFSGGVNTKSDAKDLEENQVYLLLDAMVDKPGIVRHQGGFPQTTTYWGTSWQSSAGKVKPGRGLFHFNADYSPYDDSNKSTIMFAHKSITNDGYIDIYSDDGTNSGLNQDATIGATGIRVKQLDMTTGISSDSSMEQDCAFFYVDGALRISHMDYASEVATGTQPTNYQEVMWYGFLTGGVRYPYNKAGDTYTIIDDIASGGQWALDTAFCEPPTAGLVGPHSSDKGSAHAYAGSSATSASDNSNTVDSSGSSYYQHSTIATLSTCTATDTRPSGSSTGTLAGWHQDARQDPAGASGVNVKRHILVQRGKLDVSASNTAFGSTPGPSPSHMSAIHNIDDDKILGIGADDGFISSSMINIMPPPGCGFNIGAQFYEDLIDEGTEDEEVAEDSKWGPGFYDIGTTFIYEGAQESTIFINQPIGYGTSETGHDSSGTLNKLSKQLNTEYKLQISVFLTAPYPPRVRGGRVYIRKTNDKDGNTDLGSWRMLAEIDISEGIRTSLADDFTPFQTMILTTSSTTPADITSPGTEGTDYFATSNGYTLPNHASVSGTPVLNAYSFLTANTLMKLTTGDENPHKTYGGMEIPAPNEETYTLLSLLEDSETSTRARFKTACVMNRRAYIGNVYMSDSTGDGTSLKHYGDRIVKSPRNKFDMFPANNFVDVTINDGDEIVHLQPNADRLMVFKKRRLYILNMSEEEEYVENQWEGLGIHTPGAVAPIPIGVAWVNENGCYIFDGEDMQDITGNLQIQNDGSIYSWNEWFAGKFYQADPEGMKHIICGWDHAAKHLVVTSAYDNGTAYDGNNNSNIMIYDFETKSWSFGIDRFGTFDATSSSTYVTTMGTKTNFINISENGALMINADYKSSHTKRDNVKGEMTYDSSPRECKDFKIITGATDFGYGGLVKRFYSVYVTWTNSSYGGSDEDIKVQYSVNGVDHTVVNTWTDLGYVNNELANLQLKTTKFDISPIQEAETISIRLKKKKANYFTKTFELNDISIVYRFKGVR